MNYDELLLRVKRDIPELEGRLKAPGAVYVRSVRKTYLTFESTVLVGEKQFLALERLLRKCLPGRELALRVVSPSLREDFLRNTAGYRTVLQDFLKRNYPASAGWVDRIDWVSDKGRITLIMPDEFSLNYMREVNIEPRLCRTVREIFDADVTVELSVAGSREEMLRKLREERQKDELTLRSGETQLPRQETTDPDKAKTDGGSTARGKNATGPDGKKPRSVDKTITGKKIAETPTEIAKLTFESGMVTVEGEMFELDIKELKGGETVLVTFAVTDYTSSVYCKMFLRYRPRFSRNGDNTDIKEEEKQAVRDKTDRLHDGMRVRVRGGCDIDRYSHELTVMVRDMTEIDDKPVREDNAPEKRVELHLHTNMSTMDALTPVDKLIERAIRWGHSAVAVTDHGVVQALPDAFRAAKGKIKLIPGCEGYLTEDDGKIAVYGKTPDAHTPRNRHIILLAKNRTGLVNLNRLVSASNLEHFKKVPHMPRGLIEKYREGLIIGSACEMGELFRAVLAGENEETLKKIAGFYDFLEIQPTGNNAFLIREKTVKDTDGLRELNRKIVKLGDELGKPVVATGDVHFLDPEDAIGRAVIQAGMGYHDADSQPPLYLKTTDEMLEEFEYLGKEKAREVVIINPRRIADSVEAMSLFPEHPKGEETFQPFWPEAEEFIQNLTWTTAVGMYGDPLPEIVEARLQKELKSIVGYGYCTLYQIAQKLVSRSLEEGYLVGSRGSVGSSLVAHMCGITEVNALPPHYRCENCHKAYFDIDRTRYHVGVDLPDKICPDCGRKLIKDGFDIPFEVFLGFEGDKVPDIDLNFSGEYQSKAHHYVEELFGEGHVFRAGTITGLADKLAYGYAANYLREHGIQIGNAELTRLAKACKGVKKTTGQHPGGMVVVPKEYEIYEFTAVQHPADDLNSATTTHLDFQSMHDILVKLDCLGHDDPTMMHELEMLTGVNFRDVPLDDPGVRSLFTSPDALGVSAEELLCNTGTYGIPEFGTGFVRNMLEETHPSTMEELLRISGLSHGTDVWLGNAQEIISNGTAVLSECVCCRDDIMNYLISRGEDPKTAFVTMESVRKGKGLKPFMEKAMRGANVPDWFMDSCRKIKYLFPKGHAVAYVTMSLRVAWFKLHYPLAYYGAYFTVRGDGFDAATMRISPDECRDRINRIRGMEDASTNDKKVLTCLELILEMNLRGIRFLPVDLYKSDLRRFTAEEGNLRCPLASLGGLGENAAMAIAEARKDGMFQSVEDLQMRTHIGQGVVDALRNHGALEGMVETGQVTMFL